MVMWETLHNNVNIDSSEDSEFAGHLEDSNIYFMWNIVHVWKPHICSIKLDLQEADVCVTQFNRRVNYFC